MENKEIKIYVKILDAILSAGVPTPACPVDQPYLHQLYQQTTRSDHSH